MMFTILSWSFTILLSLIFLYSVIQLELLFQTARTDRKSEHTKLRRDENLPQVTIQLPVYNELVVIERLLRNITKMVYPRDKLEIQVLDDSTDATTELINELLSDIRRTGININHLHRSHRIGYKAGALKAGLTKSKGKFIAVFDSDFLPDENWLLRTLPYFQDSKVAVVQTRWGHLNKSYSILTRVQAFLLDFHFFLEQTGRSAGKRFLNFNGTAGIWRKEAILDAGNWSGDTLTEDLDLSYRCQMKGWKIHYLEQVETMAELPVTIEAAKSQQFRWNKGAAENFRKNFWPLLRNPEISLGTKIHCFFHLLNSSFFLVVLVMALISIPLMLVSTSSRLPWIIPSLFSVTGIFFFISYWNSFMKSNGSRKMSLFVYPIQFFLFFSIAMGMSLHNSIAVLEGHFRKKSSFVRTPKFNLKSHQKPPKERLVVTPEYLIECVLAWIFGFATLYGIAAGQYLLVVFHFMLFFGFSYIVLAPLNFSYKH